MSRVIRIAVLLALASGSTHSQDSSKVAKELEKTLGELTEELHHIQRVLQEISRLSKTGGAGGSTGSEQSNEQIQTVADIALAQQAYQQGRIAEERRQYETAVEAFTRAIQLFPKSEVNYFRRGRVYFELGLLELGLRDLNQSLQLQPDNSRALELRARIYRGLKSTIWRSQTFKQQPYATPKIPTTS
jgi:tetratricopeptide (TPR) repeat protein